MRPSLRSQDVAAQPPHSATVTLVGQVPASARTQDHRTLSGSGCVWMVALLLRSTLAFALRAATFGRAAIVMRRAPLVGREGCRWWPVLTVLWMCPRLRGSVRGAVARLLRGCAGRAVRRPGPAGSARSAVRRWRRRLRCRMWCRTWRRLCRRTCRSLSVGSLRCCLGILLGSPRCRRARTLRRCASCSRRISSSAG